MTKETHPLDAEAKEINTLRRLLKTIRSLSDSLLRRHLEHVKADLKKRTGEEQ